MPYRPHSRVRVDPEAPVGASVCMRCGKWWNRPELSWQYDWNGLELVNTGLLVCPECLDQPSPSRRSVVLPPDPAPVYNVRSEPFAIDFVSQVTLGRGLLYATGYMRVTLT